MDAKALLRDTLDILNREIGNLKATSKDTSLSETDSQKLCSYVKVLAVLSNAHLDAEDEVKALSKAEITAALKEFANARK